MNIYPFYSQNKSVDEIYFDPNNLQTSNHVKSLGVYFDSKLLMDRQVNEVVRTCSYRLKNLSRVGSKLSTDLKKTLVQCYILNKIDYANSVYTGLSQRHLNKLQCVENAAARFVCSFHGLNREWRQQRIIHDLLHKLHFLPVRCAGYYSLTNVLTMYRPPI